MHEPRLSEAERLCLARGAKLTPLRRRVLEILLQAGHPLGAYAILNVLAKEGRRPLPPTVYRALDFLLAQGLVHKVHSINSFMACCISDRPHAAELFVCRHCGSTREVPRRSWQRDIAAAEAPPGFAVESLILEVQGTCHDCRERRSL
jgi:Fur family zinc uptake transcriptional regulator